MNFAEYAQHGWALCSIPRGYKGPLEKDWSLPGHAVPNPSNLPGAGLMHAYSGTCAIDVDNLTEARAFLTARGIDLDALLNAKDAVQIVSGRPGRAKLLYRMPTPRASRKIAPYTNPIDGKQYHALELRCGSRKGGTVQDVLPPTIHPDTGRPYEWRFGNPMVGSWQALPDIPGALLELWGEDVSSERPVDLIGALEEPQGADIEELRSYLAYHDPDGPYDDWLAVGMALHNTTGGAPAGLALWDEWSRKGAKYGESKNGLPAQFPAAKWPSFTAGIVNGYTIGYLKSKAPAPLDAFPVVTEEFKADAPAASPHGKDVRPGAIIREALSPLVFVSSMGAYFDRVRRTTLSLQSVDHLYSPQMPVVHTVGNNGAAKSYQPKPSEELRRAPWKEVVYGVGLHPGHGDFYEDAGLRYLNTFEPVKVTPLAPTPSEIEAFNFMWSRPAEPEFRDWLLNFYAHAVQRPGVKITAAPLLVGHATGSGKNTLMKVLPQLLFGRRYVDTMTSEVLRGNFSDQLASTWWLYFEELHSGSDKVGRIQVANRVKSWITDDTVVVHAKGFKPYSIPNLIQITASSNYEDDAIHLDDADRRWSIGHIEKGMTDREASDLYKFLDSPRAPGVLRHIFGNVVLNGFNPRSRAPETAAKRVMVRVGYGHYEAELLDLIAAGAPPFDKDLLEIKDILPFVKGGGLTAARLSRIVGRAPFNFEALPAAYGKRLWAWRNGAFWKQIGPKTRDEYYAGQAGRPAGWAWDDALPLPLAEACGLAD